MRLSASKYYALLSVPCSSGVPGLPAMIKPKVLALTNKSILLKAFEAALASNKWNFVCNLN